MATANREHKDTLFRDLFGSEERKEYALALYNALNGTGYDDPEALELTTLSGVIYMHMKNDVSFILDGTMSLWEHQSTRNPNMPLRGLLYLSELYKGQVEAQGRPTSRYGNKRLELPTPLYYVFYNGRAKAPEREELRLSESYTNGPGCLELVATVLNVNAGHNPELMAACKELADYAELIARIRSNGRNRGLPLGEAVDAAVDSCIAEGILEEYLRKRRAEATDIMLTEFDEEREMALLRKEWREEDLQEGIEIGRKEGLEEARRTLIAKLVESGFDADELERALAD